MLTIVQGKAKEKKKERKLKLGGKVNIHLDADEEKSYLENTYKKMLNLQCNEMERMERTKN